MTKDIETLMLWSNVSNSIFVAHSLESSYLRKLANESLPYIEELANNYIDKLTLMQLDELIHDCDLGYYRYLNKNNKYALNWARLKNIFEDAKKIVMKQLAKKFNVNKMCKDIHDIQCHIDWDHKYVDLLPICKEALKEYKSNASFPTESPEYFTWYGLTEYVFKSADGFIKREKLKIEKIIKENQYYESLIIKNKKTLETYQM